MERAVFEELASKEQRRYDEQFTIFKETHADWENRLKLLKNDLSGGKQQATMNSSVPALKRKRCEGEGVADEKQRTQSKKKCNTKKGAIDSFRRKTLAFLWFAYDMRVGLRQQGVSDAEALQRLTTFWRALPATEIAKFEELGTKADSINNETKRMVTAVMHEMAIKQNNCTSSSNGGQVVCTTTTTTNNNFASSPKLEAIELITNSRVPPQLS
jgi:hypothetical protein